MIRLTYTFSIVLVEGMSGIASGVTIATVFW